MAEGEVVTKLRLDGSDQVKNALTQMRANLNNVIQSIQGSKAEFTGAAASAQGFGSALGVIGQAAQFATSPLGMLVVSIGAAIGLMTKMATEAVGLFKEMRELSTVTGGTASEAEDLKDTFALAGLGTEKLSFAMFRLGMSMETGGKELAHLGISLRGAGGELKQTGIVFDEIREKISRMTSSTEQSSAAAQVFGARQARGLMPILSMTSERYAELRKRAEENTSVTEGLMAATSRYIEVQAELADKLEVGRARFAEFIALPVMTKFTEWGIAILDTAKALDRFGITMQSVARRIISVIPGFNLLLGAWELYNTVIAKTDQQADKVQAKAVKAPVGPNTRLIESEIRALQERGRIQDEMTTLQLKGQQAAFAEQSKMRTGSDQEAIQSQVTMNEKLIELAEQRYARERALAEERISKTSGGHLAPEEEIKLEKERDITIQRLRQENAKALIDIDKARIADAQRLVGDEIKELKARSADRLAILEGTAKRETAELEMSNRSQQEIMQERYEIELRTIRNVRNLKFDDIAQEKEQLRALGAAHQENYAVQRQVTEQIMALNQQRVQAEQQSDTQIIEQRKKMFTEMVNLAREHAATEAGIGDELTNMAIANLQKRGQKTISQAAIAEESAQIRESGRQTMETVQAGGAVGIEQYQQAKAGQSTFQRMTQGGFDIAGAIRQGFDQALAAFTGIKQQFAPTTMNPARAESLGMRASMDPALAAFVQRQMDAGNMPAYREMMQGRGQAGAPVAAGQIADMQGKIATSGDRGIGLLIERIPDIMEGWMVKITDALIRKLEFEAART